MRRKVKSLLLGLFDAIGDSWKASDWVYPLLADKDHDISSAAKKFTDQLPQPVKVYLLRRANVVKTAVERFRQIGKIQVIEGERPPADTEDLFLYWEKQNPSEKELKRGLSHPDPFVRMRSLYLGHQKGMVNEARLAQAGKSNDWPERLISRMIHPAIPQDGKRDHVKWVNVCSGMDAEILNTRLNCKPEKYSRYAKKISPLIRWLREPLKHRLVINPKDGSILVQIPAGGFEMGGGRNRDNPKHLVHLDTYYIGVVAVTNRQYKIFVDETGHRPPDKATWGTPVWKGKSYPLEYADHPVVCVSWDDAAAYSNWAGLSLPTEAQWEKAARGPLRLIHPWGNELDGSKCRNNSNKGSGTTCPVYEYSTGVSGYGTYNQSGNVWEWCSDCYGSDYYDSSPQTNPRGPSLGSYRVVRGGSWDDIADWCRAAYRSDYNPPCRDGNLGFRCVVASDQQSSK
ncbi:formylglycine-generating enzyme family protein [Desulfobacter curvatus]|uniref:formylglycine-generating enzyme family protein n=1 Tax=Desulfobacter curvatus TaxID=2290 RepID=UPI00035FD862|nr:formylglycine-generating enzyme family protein [Desulfobacter curvatus]